MKTSFMHLLSFMTVADWYAHSDGRPPRRLGAYRDSTVDEPCALLDTDQAQPAVVTSTLKVEALTIVGNRQREGPILPQERHRGVSCMSVSRGVSEGFLRDAK